MRTIEWGRPGQGRRVLDEEGIPAIHPMGLPEHRLSLYPEDAANIVHGDAMQAMLRRLLKVDAIPSGLAQEARDLLAQVDAVRDRLNPAPAEDGDPGGPRP